jgi:type II secretory pathway component PulM
MTGIGALWTSRTPRERALIAIALAIALPTGLVYGVWRPGLAAERSAADRSRLAASDLKEASALAGLVRTRSERARALSSEALRSEIEEAARIAGVEIMSVDPTPEGVGIVLSAASSQAALGGIEAVCERTGLTLASARLEATGGMGLSARVQLVRDGA